MMIKFGQRRGHFVCCGKPTGCQAPLDGCAYRVLRLREPQKVGGSRRHRRAMAARAAYEAHLMNKPE